MDIKDTVAKNIKAAREAKHLTLDMAAAATGVSRSMLIQIEKGDVNPTISVLWKIANGYKVSFTALMESAPRQATVMRGAEAAVMEEDGGRYRIQALFPFDERHSFEAYRVTIVPGGGLTAEPHMSGTEETLTVFEGAVEITAGKESFLLQAGDSLRFMADVPHSYRCIGDSTAILHMLIYYGK